MLHRVLASFMPFVPPPSLSKTIFFEFQNTQHVVALATRVQVTRVPRKQKRTRTRERALVIIVALVKKLQRKRKRKRTRKKVGCAKLWAFTKQKFI